MRTAKFDKMAVGEVSINFLTAPTHMKAKAAFVSRTSGSTHGWTECTNWSEATFIKVAELRASMEADLERIHFDDGTTATPGVVEQIGHDGLGESLGAVPQG